MRPPFRWAHTESLPFFHLNGGCCGDEVFQTTGCRYDLERFGCVSVNDPRQANLLIVSGFINQKLFPSLQAIYQELRDPKYVISVGACACTGGLFSLPEKNSTLLEGKPPVDIYIPGCPPRPEAIMNGIIALKEKINGRTNLAEKY